MTGPPRILVVAPFARGAPFGGSQRGTALAERLEARGLAVDWLHVPPVSKSLPAKVRGALHLRPGVVSYHFDPRVRVPEDAPAIVIAEHSYMLPHLAGATHPVVDFQNLEWRVLEEIADRIALPGGAYLRAQSALMKRFEVRALRHAALALLPTHVDLEWAGSRSTRTPPLLVPNVLPAADVAAAERIRRLRDSARPIPGLLVYVGTLTFRPNRLALLEFLQGAWPRLRRVDPGLRLVVAGRIDEHLRAALERFPSVRVEGYVEDLEPLLAQAAAAILPPTSRTGSNLRLLFYGLAGVPVASAESVDGWAAAVSEVMDEPGLRRGRGAYEEARSLQEDSRPWDELAARLEALG